MVLKITLTLVLAVVWFLVVIVGTGAEYSYDVDADAPDGSVEATRLDRIIRRTVARRSLWFVAALAVLWLAL